MLVFFKNLSLVEFWNRYVALFLLSSVINSFGWFWMKVFAIYKGSVVPQGFILGSTFFLLKIDDLADDAICIIAIYADDTSLYSK